MDELVGIISILLVMLLFSLLLLGIGSFYGADWETVAHGVLTFMWLIAVFCLGAYALFRVVERM